MRINGKQSLYESFQTNLKESEYYYKEFSGAGEIDYLEFDDEWEAQNYAEKINKETGNETAVYKMSNDECIALFDAKEKTECAKPGKVNLKEVYKSLKEGYKPVQDMWEGPGTYYIAAKPVTGTSLESSYDISDEEQFKKFLNDHPEYIENNCKGYRANLHTRGTSSYSGTYWNDKLKESYAIVNYYDDKGDPKEKICNGSSPKAVESKVKRIADRYEIVDIHQASADVADSEYLNSLGKGVLRKDTWNSTFEESVKLTESEGKHKVPDLAKECIENDIYDSRSINVRGALFHGDTLVVESRDELTEEVFDKIAKIIESYFKSYGVVADGGIEDDGNKVLAIDCYMTEEGYKEYLANADEDETLTINGQTFKDVSDAKAWLDEKIAEYGNTYWFSNEDKATLNKLIEKFGNTYFWR